jgi:hypothetical protein
VNVGDLWVAATGNSSRWLGQRTHYEVEFALRDQERIMKLNAKRDGVSVKSLKSKLTPLRPQDFDPRVATQQVEQCVLDRVIGATTAMPDVLTALQEQEAASGLIEQPTPAVEPGAAAPAARAKQRYSRRPAHGCSGERRRCAQHVRRPLQRLSLTESNFSENPMTAQLTGPDPNDLRGRYQHRCCLVDGAAHQP